MAAMKGPARARGSCLSWSLGLGMNIKIKSPFKFWRLKEVNDKFRVWSSSLENRVNNRKLLGGEDGVEAGRESVL